MFLIPSTRLTSNCLVSRRFFSVGTKNLSGKTAIVTGSTSGIGLGIAGVLAKNGVNIVFNGFGGESAISKIKKDLESHLVKVHYSGADMSNPVEIKKMVKEASEIFGGVDILVNNAGIQHVSRIDDFPDEKWDALISINLSSAFHSIKAVLPYMRNKKWGRIINTSSVHGLVASKNKSAYVASKHGLVGLTKAVALELAGTGITVNCINPGWVLTPLVEAQIQLKAKENDISREKAEKLLLSEKQPSEQFVNVDSLGNLVAFLCTDSADQITGITIPVDGGWTAQ